MATKYTVKKPFIVVYFILILLGFLLTIGRWYSVVDIDFVVINGVIHSHISNFSLSLIVYLGIGYSWLIYGTKFKYTMLLGVFLIIGNFVCETLMGFMNTTDIVDAIYGTASVLIAFVFLLATYKCGLIPKSNK